MNENMGDLHALLRWLGLNRTYTGYKYLIFTLELLRREPERLELVTKGIYPDVARRFETTVGGVDKALRTAAEVCRERLGEEPSVSDCLGRGPLSVKGFLGALNRLDREGWVGNER